MGKHYFLASTNKKLFDILIICCLFLSCNNKVDDYSYIRYQSFPKEEKLQAKVTEIDTAVFRYPVRISKYNDSMLIVFDLHNADYFYHVFSYPDFNYISYFGKRDDGLGGLISAQGLRQSSGGEIWTLDADKADLITWTLLPHSNSFVNNKTTKLDESSIGKALDFVIYNDSTFIIPVYSGANRLIYVNKVGEVVKQVGRVPSTEKYSRALHFVLTQAWRSFISYNPNNQILALATQLGEVIEIYNLKDNSHTVLIGEHGEPKFEVVDKKYAIPKGITGFSDITVTDSLIYAVFHGYTFDEKLEKRRQGVTLDGGKYIYVFSITGEPVCKYELDRRINAFYIDEKGHKIIAIDVDNSGDFLEFGF